MSDDLIKRADAIKATDECFALLARLRVTARRALETVPSSDRPQGEWIPCDKELPALMTDVLGTDEHGHIRHVYRATRHGKSRFETVEEGMGINILAWMPLPKPWKGADDE